MSADKLTATRTATAITGVVMALSTNSGLYNSYAEVTTSFATDFSVGVASKNVGYPGQTFDSLGWRSDGSVWLGGAQIGTAVTYASGNVVGIAINGATQTVLFRNITTSSAWVGPFPLSQVGVPPYHLAIGLRAIGDFGKANFYGPFATTVSPGIGFSTWNPEALFSEQSAKVVDFEAVIADGSYTSTNVNDREPMPFSSIRWGDANLDAQNNLRFTDWVWADAPSDEDLPLLSVTLQVATAPANNYIWGAWDYGTPFVIIKLHLSTTGLIQVSNVSIPAPVLTPPYIGQGHVLQLFISCDTTAVFNWSNGRVFGTENVLVSQPIEYATYPPSAVGIVQPVTASTGPGTQATFPGFTPLVPPPTIGAGGGAAPAFPPPTPPPIGHIPAGVLIGPAIAPAAVPPSTPGFVQPRFGSGSTTVPHNLFPYFTTTFPSPPIVFSNIFTDGVSPTTPPRTTTTQNILVGGWGPPVGPAFPPPSFTLPTAAQDLSVGAASEGGGSGETTIMFTDDEPLRPRRRRRDR